MSWPLGQGLLSNGAKLHQGILDVVGHATVEHRTFVQRFWDGLFPSPEETLHGPPVRRVHQRVSIHKSTV